MRDSLSNLFLIFAVDRNNVMGKDNTIPWRSPQDFQWFKTVTNENHVIMGRKTWESLPKKPLPNRHNYVVTGDPHYQAEGALVVPNLFAAIHECHRKNIEKPIFVIGGKALMEQASRYAALAYVSHIGVETEMTDDCVMGPALSPYTTTGEATIFEGDDEYPSVQVETIRFLQTPNREYSNIWTPTP